MEKTSKIWMNGELVDWDYAKVHILTHALHYATAVFEGIRSYKTEKGRALFRLHDHVWRLVHSAKIYLMEIPYSAEEICQAVRTTVKANRVDDCYIRPIAFYGYGEMGVNPLPNKVSLAIAAWRWGAYLGDEAVRNGARCMVSSWRRISPLTLPPQAKSSANYANSVLAKIEALKAGYHEAILLNTHGMVSEGTGENIFRLKQGILSTPPGSAGVLRGITRDSIVHLASEIGIECKKVDMSREELYTSDELFLCGTAAEITPIREVDGRKIGNGSWPITARLQMLLGDAVRGRNPKFAHWLDYIE